METTGQLVVAVDISEIAREIGRLADDPAPVLVIWTDGIVVGGVASTELRTPVAGDRLWSRLAGGTHFATVGDSALYAIGPEEPLVVYPNSGRTEYSLRVTAGTDAGVSIGDEEPHKSTVLVFTTLDGILTLLAVDPTIGTALWRQAGAGAGFGQAVLAGEWLVVQNDDCGVTVAFGELPDDATRDVPPSGASGAGGSGLSFDSTIDLLSLVVSILAITQLVHEGRTRVRV